MKIRNKKTGDIVRVGFLSNDDGTEIGFRECNKNSLYFYNSLAELIEEWEDYVESKEYWFIDDTSFTGINNGIDKNRKMENFDKEIGNYFLSLEEAEKAVEKLKAWKRLKDNGFKFTGWEKHPDFTGDFRITASDEWNCSDKDLDLLFGGEE